jgi:transposase
VPQNFIECDREQVLLLPPSLRDWLPGDHLAWFALDAVEEMDLSVFYGAYRADGWGRAAFEPPMMVALLLYAYAIGDRSSRGIERRCREYVAFRVLTANRVPDHATIARFRARHEQALADIFEQVLALCAKAGLVSVGLVALDGSLLAGNASPAATRSYAAIRAEVERMLSEVPRPMRARMRSWATAGAMSCPPGLPIGARAASGYAAARRNSSAINAQSRRPTRRTSLGAPPGRPSTPASWPAASRHRPTPTRSPSAGSLPAIPTRGR